MNDFTIYIPTYRRVGDQETWSHLSPYWKKHAFLVAKPEEVSRLTDLGYNTVTCNVSGIANTRQWILENHDLRRGEYIIMMDDDLKFYTRRQDIPSRFLGMEKGGAEFNRMMTLFTGMMYGVPFGSISPRSGANRHLEPFLHNVRIYDMWGMNVRVAREEGIQINRLQFMEDFDTILQFLTKGFYTMTLNTHCKGDKGSNVKGGCSEYRDDEGQAEAAHALAALWPEFVTVTERPAWNGMAGTRTDVRVAWKKAYQAGVEGRELIGRPQEPTSVL